MLPSSLVYREQGKIKMHNQDPYMYTVRECIGVTDPGTDRVQQRDHNISLFMFEEREVTARRILSHIHTEEIG